MEFALDPMLQSAEVVVVVWAFVELFKEKPSKRTTALTSLAAVIGAVAMMRYYGITYENAFDGALVGVFASAAHKLGGNAVSPFIQNVLSSKTKK